MANDISRVLFGVVICILVIMVFYYLFSPSTSPEETTTISYSTVSTAPTTAIVGQYSLSNISAFCNITSQSSQQPGWRIWTFGATGTAAASTSGSHVTVGYTQNMSCDNPVTCTAPMTITCPSWSQSSIFDCERNNGQPDTTSWNASQSNDYSSGWTFRLVVAEWHDGVQKVALLNVTCPV